MGWGTEKKPFYANEASEQMLRLETMYYFRGTQYSSALLGPEIQVAGGGARQVEGSDLKQLCTFFLEPYSKGTGTHLKGCKTKCHGIRFVWSAVRG